MYFYMLMIETQKFIHLVAKTLGAKAEVLKDIYEIIIPGNPN